MKFERGRHQQEARRLVPKGDSRKVSVNPEFAAVEVPFDPDPVVERLHGEVQVGRGLQLDYDQPSGAIDGKQVEYAALAGGEGRDLAVDRIGQKRGVEDLDLRARLGFEPRLGILPIKRMLAIAAGAVDL